jgi:hypothetical protein
LRVLVVVLVVVVFLVVSTVGAGAAIVVESMGAMVGVVVVVLVLVVDEAPTSPPAVPLAAGVSLLFPQAPTATRVARAVIAVMALTRMCVSFDCEEGSGAVRGALMTEREWWTAQAAKAGPRAVQPG